MCAFFAFEETCLNIKSLAREPLVHFLLIGLGLFLIYGKFAPASSDSQRIVISQSVADEISRQFTSTWTRPPTQEELKNLIDGYIKDEVLYREGVALGLDRDDPVIKRRLRQKLEVIIEEEGSQAPTDADLNGYLAKHADMFRLPPVVSFDQVLFNPSEYGNGLEQVFNASKAAVEGGASPDSQGSASMLPKHVEQLSVDLVARDFGEEFGKSLVTAPVGKWLGPVASGFGVHLLRVTERKDGYLPTLDEARKAVTREWENERRKASLESNYARIKSQYDVVIEANAATAGAAK